MTRLARAGTWRGLSMDLLLKLSQGIDAVNRRIGQFFALMVLLAILVSAVNATVRKIFDLSSNAWLELQWVLFSMVFLFCAPWTLQLNEHVRIDIVNSMMPRPVRSTIELVGHALFLLPLTIIMIVTSVPFFLESFRLNEQSFSAGGLPQWPAKSLIMIGFALLALQGISELIKRIAIMRGIIPDPRETQRSALEAEVEHLIEGTQKH
jgi:TRAP-type mannitol/chloroaromatic compound transport system permease small subunit